AGAAGAEPEQYRPGQEDEEDAEVEGQRDLERRPEVDMAQDHCPALRFLDHLDLGVTQPVSQRGLRGGGRPAGRSGGDPSRSGRAHDASFSSVISDSRTGATADTLSSVPTRAMRTPVASRPWDEISPA